MEKESTAANEFIDEQFQIIESRVGNLIEQVITLQRKISDKPIML